MPTRIRLALPEDAPSLVDIYGPFCTETPVSFEAVAPTPEEMAQRVLKVTEFRPWLVLEQEGRIAGYVYASAHRDRVAYQWAVDVAAYIAADYRRQGVGRALYTALFRVLILQGYFKAYAGITLPNPGSVGLHEAFGFEPVGIYRNVGYKMGAWHDVVWNVLTLQPPVIEPEPPRSVHTVLGTPEWDAAMAAGLALLREKYI
jgi:L-amino acid N-acyltransferase YncA